MSSASPAGAPPRPRGLARRDRWLVGLASLTALVLAGALALYMDAQRQASERTRVDSLARDHVRTIGNAVDRAMSASFALAALVRQGGGEVADFDAVATEMLEYYPSVSVLALSPGGVITQTAPLEPNRASLGFDQFGDPVQGAEARMARDTGRLTLAGPLELVQGGQGIVGRLPVFLDGQDEPRRFWGLISVVVRVPDLLEESGLDLLWELGINYELWRLHPGTGERRTIAAAGLPGLRDPVEHGVELPNGTWYLSAAPAVGWSNPLVLGLQLSMALAFALLVGWLTHLLLALRAHRRHLEAEVESRTAEIRDARNQLAGTLAAIPDPLFEVDRELVYLGFHSPRRDLLAAPPDAFLGTRVTDHVPAHVAEQVRATLDEVDRDGFSVGRQYELEVAGGRRWFELSAARKPVSEGDAPRYIVLARDVTARLKADEARRTAEARFLQAQKLESIGRLAGGVAHDFNNLLTVMRGAADLAGEQLPPDHPAHAELEQVRGAAGRGAALTRQLLSYSSQQVLRPAPLDLNRALVELTGMLRRMIGEDVRIELRLSEAPAWIEGDANQISQVLLNLAANARDAMPRGGEVRIETSLVAGPEGGDAEPGSNGTGREVVIRFTDTGVGMPEEVRKRIFEPFFTTKERGRGTGLGLATAYGIIRQLGGRIECASAPGEGTTFEMRFPALAPGSAVPAPESTEPAAARPTAAEPAPVPGSPTTSAGTGGERRPFRVLVVEDEPGILALARKVLEREGHEVVAMENGESALAWTRETATPPDLLLTDLVMPGVSGIELAATLRGKHPELPVLFTSGFADDTIPRNEGFPPEAVFLAKPYTVHELAEAVARMLGGIPEATSAASTHPTPDPP